MKSKTVYQLIKMEVIYVKRFDIDYKDKNDLEEKIYNIEDNWDVTYQTDIFKYMPFEVHKLNSLSFDISDVYDDDIEDEDKLLDNIKKFI